MAPLFVSGTSCRSAPVELRQRVPVAEPQIPGAMAELRTRGRLGEVMLLSTCNRVEIYGVDDPRGSPPDRVFDLHCEECGVEPESLRSLVYVKTEAEAVQHCFRIASSLDSMIVGEPQILGQVKQAFAVAQRCGAAMRGGRHMRHRSRLVRVWNGPGSVRKSIEVNCVTCHGAGGKGDGPTAAGLPTKPADWTSEVVQKQADGDLFWKISNGRGPMPPWKHLPEKERWEMVSYIRSLKK